MKLIINEFGSYLSKKENRFVVKTKEKKEEYSADQIEQIIISSSSSISEGVVKLFFRCYHIQNKGIKECLELSFTLKSHKYFLWHQNL